MHFFHVAPVLNAKRRPPVARGHLGNCGHEWECHVCEPRDPELPHRTGRRGGEEALRPLLHNSPGLRFLRARTTTETQLLSPEHTWTGGEREEKNKKKNSTVLEQKGCEREFGEKASRSEENRNVTRKSTVVLHNILLIFIKTQFRPDKGRIWNCARCRRRKQPDMMMTWWWQGLSLCVLSSF